MTLPRFALLMGLMATLAGAPTLATPPNVVIIYTDDQGAVDLHSFGATDLVTPNMDAIVESGVKFTQFYAAPVCTPSRVSLLTGKAPQRVGVPGNVSATAGQTGGLPAAVYTMVDLFKSGGYRTAHVGKWHLGYTTDKQPLAHGFDQTFGHLAGCIDNFSHFFYWNGPNRHDLYRNGQEVFYPGEYFPELMLKEATALFRASRDRPFFLYFALNTPHYPYQGYPKWLDHYNQSGVPYPRNLYAAFLSTADEIIGRLVGQLEDLGLRENTIIILQSDNGYSTEERAHFGGGSAGPFRGAKACLFEGGIRVPAAISWPGRLPAGTVRTQMAVNTDWLPTLAELCGLQLAATDLDGESLVPLIDHPETAAPHAKGYCWEFRDQWAARQGNWKLLGNPVDTSHRAPLGEADRLFLVDLASDPGETTNLALRFPQRVKALQDLLAGWKNR